MFQKEKLKDLKGRLVEEKGPKLFVEVVKDIAKNNPEWKFIIVGAAKAAQSNLETNFDENMNMYFISQFNISVINFFARYLSCLIISLEI